MRLSRRLTSPSTRSPNSFHRGNSWARAYALSGRGARGLMRSLARGAECMRHHARSPLTCRTPFLCIDHVDIAMANTLMFDPKASFYSVGDAICFGGRDAGSDRKHLVAGDSFNQSLRDEVAASMARGLARGMAQQPKSYFCRAPPCDGGEAEAGGGASASPHGRRLAGFVSKC